jgi:hypothetical protein
MDEHRAFGGLETRVRGNLRITAESGSSVRRNNIPQRGSRSFPLHDYIRGMTDQTRGYENVDWDCDMGCQDRPRDAWSIHFPTRLSHTLENLLKLLHSPYPSSRYRQIKQLTFNLIEISDKCSILLVLCNLDSVRSMQARYTIIRQLCVGELILSISSFFILVSENQFERKRLELISTVQGIEEFEDELIRQFLSKLWTNLSCSPIQCFLNSRLV